MIDEINLCDIILLVGVESVSRRYSSPAHKISNATVLEQPGLYSILLSVFFYLPGKTIKAL
jgi:hypothetical protein